MTEPEIYTMKLHDTIELKNEKEGTYTYAKRVAGGWIYSQGAQNENGNYIIHTSVFVPFHNEFQYASTGEF